MRSHCVSEIILKSSICITLHGKLSGWNFSFKRCISEKMRWPNLYPIKEVWSAFSLPDQGYCLTKWTEWCNDWKLVINYSSARWSLTSFASLVIERGECWFWSTSIIRRTYPTLFERVKPSSCFRCPPSRALLNGYGNEGILPSLFLSNPYWTIRANSERMGNQCISIYSPNLCVACALSFPVACFTLHS